MNPWITWHRKNTGWWLRNRKSQKCVELKLGYLQWFSCLPWVALREIDQGLVFVLSTPIDTDIGSRVTPFGEIHTLRPSASDTSCGPEYGLPYVARCLVSLRAIIIFGTHQKVGLVQFWYAISNGLKWAVNNIKERRLTYEGGYLMAFQFNNYTLDNIIGRK